MNDSSVYQATCTKCNAAKPLTEFRVRKDRPLGRSSWCNECTRANVRLRANSPEGRKWDSAYKKTPERRAKINERRRQTYSREYENERKARYRNDPRYPERRRIYNSKRWVWRIKSTYGLTKVQFDAMVKAQHGVCAICLSPPPKGKRQRLYVDHDHQSNAIRGLLCTRCNTAIGQLRDSPDIAERAAAYLRQHAQLKLVV